VAAVVDLFRKPLDEVTENDLCERLVDFDECFIVEYKAGGKWSDKAGIARSIASFANTYGGWLFIGIPESDGHPVLDGELGVSSDTGMVERVYQLAASHLSPTPHILCVEIPVGEEMSVIAVSVPESPDPPHIHIQTGRIFMRNGNTTEPVRLTDRGELNLLHEKADRSRRAVGELLDAHGAGSELAGFVAEVAQSTADPTYAWTCLVYPTILVAGIAPYAVNRSFPQCEWPGRGEFVFGYAEDHRPLDRRFSANGCHVCCERGKGFYVDMYGHIASCGVGDRLDVARWDLDSRVQHLLKGVGAVYEAARYHGPAVLEYAVWQADNELCRVRRDLISTDYDKKIVRSVGEEVMRILRGWDGPIR
jgi:hypothetical protein